MYYRFLETDDEYFDPAGGHHRQGFWMIYGVFLPKDVLEKLYFKNAERSARRPWGEITTPCRGTSGSAEFGHT